MRVLKNLLRSRKFWLTVGAVVVAAVNSQYALIPYIILAEVGAISLEDAAHKLGIKWGEDIKPEDELQQLGEIIQELRRLEEK